MSDDRNNNAGNVDDQILQWVTYRLGDETYGINVMQVQEVLRYSEIASGYRRKKSPIILVWSLLSLMNR